MAKEAKETQGDTKSSSFSGTPNSSAGEPQSRPARQKMSLFPPEWAVNDAAAAPDKDNSVPTLRVNWQLKTIWPVAVVLLIGMLQSAGSSSWYWLRPFSAR